MNLWLMFSLCVMVKPDSSAVYILNEHLQLVTSTSLRWVEAENGERPLHAVMGGTNGTQSLFVCRAGSDNSFPGQLSWDGCLTVVQGWQSQLFNKYQALVNEEGSARLEWQEWRQFTALPQGAVNTAKDVYVAREEDNAVWHNFLGGLHLHQQYGLIVVPPQGRRLTIGQVLVEHIPIKYELVAFKPDRLRSVKSNEVWLEEPLDQKNYTYWNELYFGRGQNVATGSRVVLHMGNGTKIPLQWGIPQRLPQTTQLTFENQKARVLATRIERQWDYFATLSAYYRDGAILMRPIKGVFRQISHENLRPVLGEVPKKPQKTTTSFPSLSEDLRHYQASSKAHHPSKILIILLVQCITKSFYFV